MSQGSPPGATALIVRAASGLWLAFATSLALAFLVLWASGIPGWFRWQPGTPLGGDLMQHRAAAEIARSQGVVAPYQNFNLSQTMEELFFQPAGRATRQNHLYPPLLTAALVPLLSIPYPGWVAGWAALSLAAWAAAAWLLTGPRLRDPFMALTWATLPAAWYNLVLGQNGALTLLLLALALRASDTFPARAGICLATTFHKPHLAPYLAGFALFRGDFRLFAATAAAALGLLALAVATLGLEPHIAWITSMLEHGRGLHEREPATHIGWNGLFLSFAPIGSPDSLPALALSAVGTALALAWVWRFRTRLRPSEVLAFAAACWLSLSPHAKPYDLMLAFPWAIVVWDRLPPGGKRNLWLAAFAGLGLAGIGGRFAGFSFTAPLITLWTLAGVRIVSGAPTPRPATPAPAAP
jgi:hypothetical protein